MEYSDESLEEEEFMDETSQSDQSQVFDSELPSQHLYFETTENVRGVSLFYQPHDICEIPVCKHHSLVYPGEIFPMIFHEDCFFKLTKNDDGVIFGIIFEKGLDEDKRFGVTCQVFEKGLQNGQFQIKSKAQQRFVIVKSNNQECVVRRDQTYFAKIKILPEILLKDPFHLAMSNSCMKLSKNASNQNQLKKFLSASTPWSNFVYEHYSIQTVTEKIERYLAMLKIKAPQDPVLKSFWLARNVPLNYDDKLKLFQTNCINKRLILIGKSLENTCFFLCKTCRNKIAIYEDIFAMSKNAVNDNYCNSSGYVHETFTVTKILESAVQMIDEPSTEFSWFPGYSWQIMICTCCDTHVGWKFSALSNRKLRPQTFFGLSCKSLWIQSNDEKERQNEENDVSDSD